MQTTQRAAPPAKVNAAQNETGKCSTISETVRQGLAEGNAFVLSRFASHCPARLSKSFSLQDGELQKSPGGNMSRGEVQTVRFESMADFAALLPTLTPAHALSYGTCQHEHAAIVPKGKAAQTKHEHLPVIARTREHFTFPAGPGLLMCDYDPEKDTEPLTPEQLLAVLYEVCPNLEHAPHVLRPSASSYIYNGQTSECLNGQGGLRVWFLVADAQDIPRAGVVLFKRLWLAGHGRIDVSRAGSLLVRAIADDAVWQPERLDFCGGAACEAPLEQRLPDPEVYNAEAEPLDTRAALPDLNEAEQKQYVKMVQEAKREKRPEADEQQELWIQDRISASLEGQELEVHEREKAVEQLRETLTQAVKKILLGDFELLPDKGDPVTVAEVLDNPERWHNRRFHDPLEPDYGNDSRIAWANLRAAGKQYLWSNAHGGQRFQLHRARHTIQVPAGERVQIVGKALELMRLDGGVFDRGGELVRLDASGNVHPLGLDGLRFHLDALARWQKFDKRSQEWTPCDAPEPVAKGIMASRGNWKLPVLRAVATAPFMDPNTGRIVDVDGYDEQTGIILHCNHLNRWPGVPTNPTAEHVKTSLATLWKPFQDFPFVDDVARGVWLAALLTAPIRPALPTAPALLVGAPTAGSGKTLLTTCMAIISGIESPPVMTMTSDEQENRKRLFSMGRTGAPAVLLDNLTGAFDSDALCAWLTSGAFTDRVLGQSEVVEIPTRSLMLMTGNNVLLRGDLCRRVVTCEIDTQTERPWSRAYGLDPAAYCREHRLEMVAAALTILKAAYGPQTQMQGRTASFELWSDTVRRAVVWVGEQGFINVADPMKSVEANYEADPESAKLEALLGAWHQAFGDVPQTVPDVIRRAENYQDAQLFDALEEIAGERGSINSRRLGRWIERMKKRIVAGRCFELFGKRDNRKVWRVKSSFSSKSSFVTPYAENCHLTLIERSAKQTKKTTETTSRTWVEGTV